MTVFDGDGGRRETSPVSNTSASDTVWQLWAATTSTSSSATTNIRITDDDPQIIARPPDTPRPEPVQRLRVIRRVQGEYVDNCNSNRIICDNPHGDCYHVTGYIDERGRMMYRGGEPSCEDRMRYWKRGYDEYIIICYNPECDLCQNRRTNVELRAMQQFVRQQAIARGIREKRAKRGERAHELIMDNLTAEQRLQVEKTNHFLQRGSHNGLYQISYAKDSEGSYIYEVYDDYGHYGDRNKTMDEVGIELWHAKSFCIHPAEGYPSGDHALAYKLMVTAAEDHFAYLANAGNYISYNERKDAIVTEKRCPACKDGDNLSRVLNTGRGLPGVYDCNNCAAKFGAGLMAEPCPSCERTRLFPYYTRNDKGEYVKLGHCGYCGANREAPAQWTTFDEEWLHAETCMWQPPHKLADCQGGGIPDFMAPIGRLT